jgi:hypothetical protein
MKATLEFNLDESDDERAHLRCVLSEKMALVIWEFLYNTRKGVEYELDEKKDLSRYDSVDIVYEKFIELLNEQSIDIDKLIV